MLRGRTLPCFVDSIIIDKLSSESRAKALIADLIRADQAGMSTAGLAQSQVLMVSFTGYEASLRGQLSSRTPLLDRRPQRLEGAGKVSDIVPGAGAECIGEYACLSKIAPEEHNARIEIVFWQWGFLQST
jgi:hypothetical protein